MTQPIGVQAQPEALEMFRQFLSDVALELPPGASVTFTATVTNAHPPAPLPPQPAQVVNNYLRRWSLLQLSRLVTQQVHQHPVRVVNNDHAYVVSPETTERYYPLAGLFAVIGAIIGALISVWSVVALQEGDVNIFTNGMSTVVTSLHDNSGLLALAVMAGAAIIGGIGYMIGHAPGLARVRQTVPRYVDDNSPEAEALRQNSTEV